MASENGKIFPLHLDRKPADSSLSHLDRGERDAIALAVELEATLILLDE